jgi:RNA recognition motif-containing protein
MQRPKVESRTTVYVSNLPLTSTEKDVAELFAYLDIKSIHIARRLNGRLKGFCFVEFNTHVGQREALCRSGTMMNGRMVIVQPCMEEGYTSNL